MFGAICKKHFNKIYSIRERTVHTLITLKWAQSLSYSTKESKLQTVKKQWSESLKTPQVPPLVAALKVNVNAAVGLTWVCCRPLSNILPGGNPFCLDVCGCTVSRHYGIFHIEGKVVVTHNDKLSERIWEAAWCFCIMYAANVQSDAARAAAVDIAGS